MYVSDAEALLAKVQPEAPAQQMRFDLVLELLDDVRRLDDQIKTSHRRIRLAVRASGTSVTEVYGVGPIHAAMIIGYSGDIGRFANQDAYASYNGTAPVERSSGGRIVHRLSQRGNRKVNHALHMVAVTQIRNPGTEGRAEVADNPTTSDGVGRPGLDPGTLGLKVMGEPSTGCHRFHTTSSCQATCPASWTEWASVRPFQ
jgi:transposase